MQYDRKETMSNSNENTPRIIVVDKAGRGDKTTIWSAMYEASRTPGTVIQVRPGTYDENLEIAGGVALVADGAMGTVIIEGRLTVNGGGPLIQGFFIKSTVIGVPAVSVIGGAPIIAGCVITAPVPDATALEVRNLNSSPRLIQTVFSGSGHCGIWVHSGATGSFEGCEIWGNGGEGVVIQNGGNAIFTKCTIKENGGNGIFVTERGKGKFEQCISAANRRGASIREGGDPIFIECTFTDNLEYGIIIRDGGIGNISNCLLKDNKIDAWYVQSTGWFSTPPGIRTNNKPNSPR